MNETRIALQRGRKGRGVLGQRWDRCRWRKTRSAYEAPSLRWCSAVYYSERFLRQPGLDPSTILARLPREAILYPLAGPKPSKVAAHIVLSYGLSPTHGCPDPGGVRLIFETAR